MMEVHGIRIPTRTAWFVNGKQFDELHAALAELERRLRDAFDRLRFAPSSAAAEYPAHVFDEDGESITWHCEEVPEGTFAELILEYGESPHDPGCEWPVDPEHRYMLIERNRRGGFIAETGDDAQELVAYHFNQEYAEDWSIEALWDLREDRELSWSMKVDIT